MRRTMWLLGSAFVVATLHLALGLAVAPASSLSVVADDEAARVVGGQACGWQVIIKDNLGCGQPSKYWEGIPIEWRPMAVHRTSNGVQCTQCVISRWCTNCGNNCNMHDDLLNICGP